MSTQTRHPAMVVSAPTLGAPDGDQDPQRAMLAATPVAVAPAGSDFHSTVLATTPNESASGGAQPTGCRGGTDTRHCGAAGSRYRLGPSGKAGFLLDRALAFTADLLDDLEKLRTANSNRIGVLTRTGVDSDGVVRGFGYDESHPDVARLKAMVDGLARFEHDAVLDLQRKMRRHPLGPWVKSQRGIGEKQAARLLAAIGDPYVRPEMAYADGTVVPADPRTVSALWAYCGLHVLPGHRQNDPQQLFAGSGGDLSHPSSDAHRCFVGVAPKRRRGEKANWSTIAKTRTYLIAESCIKQLVKPCATTDLGAIHRDECTCSPYRVVYDRRRAHTRTTHPEWTDGHAHTDAMRITSKAILRDLWREAKRIHEAETATEPNPT